MPEVKREEKTQWMTDEALTMVRNGQETKQKFSKPGLESWMQFFNDYHVEIKRTITLASVRRPKRTTKKGKQKISTWRFTK